MGNTISAKARTRREKRDLEYHAKRMKSLPDKQND